MFHQTSVTW